MTRSLDFRGLLVPESFLGVPPTPRWSIAKPKIDNFLSISGPFPKFSIRAPSDEKTQIYGFNNNQKCVRNEFSRFPGSFSPKVVF